MKPAHIVILGGGYAGIIAAHRLAYKTRGQEITLINARDHFVQRIRLHQFATNQPLPLLPMTKMLAGTGVCFVKGTVTQLNPNAKSLTVQTDSGPQVFNYDYLIYALGSFTDTAKVPGVAEYALSLGTQETALTLRSRLPEVAAQSGRLIVCGGGLTGIESAAEIAEAYPTLKVSLMTAEPFGDQLSQRGRAYLHKTFDRLGIQVIDNAEISRITPDRVEYKGVAAAFDICLWTGPFAVPTLAREAGLTVNGRGQIVVDDHVCSISHPEIYAVGDAADVSDAINTPIRMACATAYPMGSYAADDLAARLRGKVHRAYDFAYVIRCISLGRHDGLIQLVDADDNPKERIITGRLGAQIKEMICRYAVWQIQHASLMYYVRHPASAQRINSPQVIPSQGR